MTAPNTINTVCISIDQLAPGTIPELTKHDVAGMDRYALHFNDAVVWLRLDQLHELYAIILRAIAEVPAPPIDEPQQLPLPFATKESA